MTNLFKKDNRINFKGLFGSLLIFSYFTLITISLSGIASSSFNLSIDAYSNDFYFFNKQFIAVILCLVMMGFMITGFRFKRKSLVFNYKILMNEKMLFLLYLSSIIVLLVVPLIGREINGARRWIFGLQPSEFIKIVYILYCAKLFAKIEDEEGENFWGIVKNKWLHFGVLFLIPILIILQKDLGTIIHYAAIFFSMLVASKFKFRDISLLSLALLGLAGSGGFMVSYRLNRILEYLAGMKKNLYGGGYQVEQSIIGLGNGGFWGVGFGNGVRKYNWLPEVHTDFIFSSIGEELGFLISLIIIFSYIIILGVGISMSIKIKDTFSKFLTIGLTFLIISQALMNLYVVSGLMPVTGIPLPFISYGRSNLITLSIAVGLLLNIIRHAEFSNDILDKEK